MLQGLSMTWLLTIVYLSLLRCALTVSLELQSRCAPGSGIRSVICTRRGTVNIVSTLICIPELKHLPPIELSNSVLLSASAIKVRFGIFMYLGKAGTSSEAWRESQCQSCTVLDHNSGKTEICACQVSMPSIVGCLRRNAHNRGRRIVGQAQLPVASCRSVCSQS